MRRTSNLLFSHLFSLLDDPTKVSQCNFAPDRQPTPKLKPPPYIVPFPEYSHALFLTQASLGQLCSCYLSLTTNFTFKGSYLNLELLVNLIILLDTKNAERYIYGSVSAGREFWPFRVIFFQKVEPEGLARFQKKGKSSEFNQKNYEQVKSSPSLKVWSHEGSTF